MMTKKTTQIKITTITGFAGVLLGILANTISTINIDNLAMENGLKNALKIMFLVSTLGITTCVICGTLAFAKIHQIGIGNNNPEKLLELSHTSLMIGIMAISYSIVIMITKDIYWTLLGIIILIITIIYVNTITKENKISQPLEAKEERSTKAFNGNSTVLTK